VNLLGDNVYNIQKNMESIIYVSKEDGLEVNTEKLSNAAVSLPEWRAKS
jgi:hypothetical protein